MIGQHRRRKTEALELARVVDEGAEPVAEPVAGLRIEMMSPERGRARAGR
jgi:hypothetical protein